MNQSIGGSIEKEESIDDEESTNDAFIGFVIVNERTVVPYT